MKKVFLIFVCAIAAMSFNPAYSDEAQFKKLLKKAGGELQKILEVSVNNASSTSSSSTSTSSKASNRRDDGKLKTESHIEGLEIKVKSCNADDNDNVIIIFTLENLNDYNAECSFRETQVYDDEGNCYEGEKYIRFAPANEQFKEYCDAKLPSGIPTKYKMRIRNVDPAASMLKMVTINLYELPIGSMTGDLQIKNLPITREGDE
jgi:hypothetical protein